MKKLQLTAALLCLCLLCGLFAACNNEPLPPAEYSVTVVVGEERSVRTCPAGEMLSLDPVQKSGWQFEGYFDEEGNVVSFPYEVTSDVTLTARWQYDTLAQQLTTALKNYLQSQKFAQSVANAQTAAAWLPLSYLRYVQGDFYTDANAAVFKKYMNMLPELVTDGKLLDLNWAGSAAAAQGWYDILDYLYTYSIAANAYEEYLFAKGLTDNTYKVYNNAIARYLEKIDAWEQSATQNKYQVAGQEVYQINLASQANSWKYFSASVFDRMSLEKVTQLLDAVAQATGSVLGHEQFLQDYAVLDGKHQAYVAEQERIAPQLQPLTDRFNEVSNLWGDLRRQWQAMEEGPQKDALKQQMDAAEAERNELIEQRNDLQKTLTALGKDFDDYFAQKNFADRYKGFLPVTQVAFGMSTVSYLAIVKANLALDSQLPHTDKTFLSYYQKDEEGNFTKKGGTPNWVGPSGRPVAASLYRNSEGYDVNFEKYRQGYFPFTDGWNQPLEEMITLDTLGKYYNHDLGTGANVTPQWALLTGYMHGIDMENYVVAQPVEGENTTYNIITLWKDNLSTDEKGSVLISDNIDMAVAVAYLARTNGVEAPSPLGAFDKACKVVTV